jgi:phosphatidylglycerophosphatase A
MSWARAVATVGGIGLIPFAPGTWGSAAAIPLAWGLHYLGGFLLLASATVAVTVLGYIATARYLDGQAEDPSEIVIDEVAGMLVALWPLSIGLTLMGSAPHLWPWPGWVLGFLLFRFFDIVKPPPVGWADRLPGPAGVMLDDLFAGAITAVLAALAAGVSHGWF